MPDTQTIVFTKKVTLTDAQIKALPSTPVVLLAAPGVGKIILPLSYIAIADTLAGGYTNLDPVLQCIINIGLGISGNSTLFDALYYISANPKFGDTSKTLFTGGVLGVLNDDWHILANSANLITPGPLENQPLAIGAYNNNGDFTGGNSVNTLAITFNYTIVDL